MSDPAVTVVMPLHDKRQYLLRAVGSVLRQGWRDLELIVVDDGSTDGGAHLLSKLDEARIRCVRTERRGPGAARNTGARLSRSPWLAFLDADDEWDASFLEKAVAAMRRAPETVLVYCDVHARNAAALRRDIASGPVTDYFGTRMRHGIGVSCSSNLLRRDAFTACGGFREDFRYAEDIEVWLRLVCQGNFYFIADASTAIEVADRSRITARASALERAEGLGRVYESFLLSLAGGALPA
jgi:glycosyltransferase involved in cell wall biosynthesis